MKSMILIFVISATLAVTAANADEFDNMVKAAEVELRQLLCDLKRVSDDPNATVKEQIKAAERMNMYNHRSDAEAYRQKVAGKFVPFKLESLAKTFGQDRVEEALSDLKDSGTDLANVGSLDCDGG